MHGKFLQHFPLKISRLVCNRNKERYSKKKYSMWYRHFLDSQRDWKTGTPPPAASGAERGRTKEHTLPWAV